MAPGQPRQAARDKARGRALSSYYWSLAFFGFGIVIAIVTTYLIPASPTLPLIIVVVSFFFVLIQDRILVVEKLENLADLATELTNAQNDLHSDIDKLQKAHEFTFNQMQRGRITDMIRLGSMEGLEKLAEKVATARAVYNTGFLADTNIIQSKIYKMWMNAIIESINRNNTRFIEILCGDIDERVEYLKSGVTSMGNYSLYVVDDQKLPPSYPFLNITILEDSEGKGYVFFGWASTRDPSWDQPVFLCYDEQCVVYFKRYFQSLQSAADLKVSI